MVVVFCEMIARFPYAPNDTVFPEVVKFAPVTVSCVSAGFAAAFVSASDAANTAFENTALPSSAKVARLRTLLPETLVDIVVSQMAKPFVLTANSARTSTEDTVSRALKERDFVRRCETDVRC